MIVGRAFKIRVNFTKTTTLFSLENSFQQKLLLSSVIQYKAMDVEFIIIIVENAKLNVINSNNRMKQSVKV